VTCSADDALAEQLLEASEKDLRGGRPLGRKVEYIRDLAAHVLSASWSGPARRALDEEAIAENGRGARPRPVDAEMFLIFHLERPDVLSGGDLGIRKRSRSSTGWRRCRAAAVMEIGEAWRLHRQPCLALSVESLAAVPGE